MRTCRIHKMGVTPTTCGWPDHGRSPRCCQSQGCPRRRECVHHKCSDSVLFRGGAVGRSSSCVHPYLDPALSEKNRTYLGEALLFHGKPQRAQPLLLLSLPSKLLLPSLLSKLLLLFRRKPPGDEAHFILGGEPHQFGRSGCLVARCTLNPFRGFATAATSNEASDASGDKANRTVLVLAMHAEVIRRVSFGWFSCGLPNMRKKRSAEDGEAGAVLYRAW